MYYNTTNEVGKKLKYFELNALKLEDQILYIFKQKPSSKLTPFEVQKLVYRKSRRLHPITSVRRAITNLTIDGKLVKTDQKKIGEYGAPNYLWTLNTSK